MNWDTLADDGAINTAITALKENGIDASVVENSAQAKKKVLEMIPEGAEVMTMTSETLRTIGLDTDLNDSGKFDSVKSKLSKMDRGKDHREMQKIGAAPEWAVGSVHAVTQDGKVVVVSNTGSQLPAYAYGASHVIWVVGTQKVVKNLEEARKRIYEYVLPLETPRARKAYGLGDDWHSNVSKELIVNKEVQTGRITLIFVKEKLGF